ncbi:hypothetical protein [Lachnoanaerobaculum gingivalis]|uniref:hypothetical protein n=1 Tax=Lachnoanaerobaculum gingivalis TaxID=2490855 RepID=UPI0028D7CA64|nr:hypothetical protein [Lachnoanaerobaculum gingivalis]
MKRFRKLVACLSVMCVVFSLGHANVFAGRIDRNAQFMSELEQAIRDSDILDINDYSIKEVNVDANNAATLNSVDEIVAYLENAEREQNDYQEYMSVDSLSEDGPRSGISFFTRHITRGTKKTFIPKYTRSTPMGTTFTLKANVKVNTKTGRILKITSPRFTKTGNNIATHVENQVYNTENNGDSAYIECHYDWVTILKIPTVTDIEIIRKSYHTYMNYRYNEVYDCGNEED